MSDITGKTLLTCLLGSPVSHSLSPAMQNMAFSETGLDYRYLAFDVKKEEIEDAVRAIRLFHIRGANLTMPLKNAVLPYLDELSRVSKLSLSVNTIINDNGRLTGTTTDGKGFTGSLLFKGFDIRGKRALILGAGGAASSVIAEMAEEKTGALIVVEKAIHLTEYELTGIPMDSLVSPQLLINIFEHNTPLHDGAVIIRGDRIMAATCYLPLSENMSISKSLGTRHRAGLGLSEVCDAAVIIVSEETGGVSVAREGQLISDVDPGHLNEILTDLQKTEKAKAKGKSHEEQDI